MGNEEKNDGSAAVVASAGKGSHTYGAGTRLSSAYTAGFDGKAFAKHFGDRKSAAHKAWLAGKKARAALAKSGG